MSGMDTETVIFSTGATCRVAEQMFTEGIAIVDDVVGAGVFAFLGALAFLGAGPAVGPGAEGGVGAAVGGGILDSRAPSRASKASTFLESHKTIEASDSTVTVGKDMIKKRPD